MLKLAACALAGTGVVLPAAAAEEDFIGTWLLWLDHSPGGWSYGTLEIESVDGALSAWVDGGPVPVSIDGESISLGFDWDDGGGTVYVSELEGQLVDGAIEGREFRDGEETGGSWWARPRSGAPGIGEPASPADFSGIWSMRTTDGTGKDAFDMTPAAREYQQAFDARFDDPVLRCVSDGLIRQTGGPFAKEILHQENRITILYEDMHEIRRIWLDRDFPEDVEFLGEALGYSIGHWEGSTLVVETRGLKEALWHRAGGKPISAEATVTEYMYIGDDGNLHIELELDDPVNYNRPPLRHTVFSPAPGYEFNYYSCDPDAFYRGMYLEGQLDTYYERSRYRR